MRYELAKELKYAGFPQGGKGEYHMLGDLYAQRYVTAKWAKGADYTYDPTLSELIEACGSKFDRLTRNEMTDDSVVWRVDYYDMALGNFGEGSTPEEAVANLWLALQKNNSEP